MKLCDQKSFLELSVIWKDEDLLELEVIAVNSNFSGKVHIYALPEYLLKFALSLLDYPVNNKNLLFEVGERDSYAYFSMKYYPVGFNGHIGVEINLESNVATEYRSEERDKLKLEIIVEPSQIDVFQKELAQLAKTEGGKAILYGRDNRLEN